MKKILPSCVFFYLWLFNGFCLKSSWLYLEEYHLFFRNTFQFESIPTCEFFSQSTFNQHTSQFFILAWTWVHMIFVYGWLYRNHRGHICLNNLKFYVSFKNLNDANKNQLFALFSLHGYVLYWHVSILINIDHFIYLQICGCQIEHIYFWDQNLQFQCDLLNTVNKMYKMVVIYLNIWNLSSSIVWISLYPALLLLIVYSILKKTANL